MEPNTIRLESETWEALLEEAEDRGFRNRSEYIREIIRNRDVIYENTTDYNENTIEELVVRVEQLEQQQTTQESTDSGESITADYEKNTADYEENTGVIDDIMDDWWPKTKRERKREAGRQALRYLHDVTRAEKEHFLKNVDHLIEEQNPNTYWKNTIRPALQEAQDEGLVRYERGPPHEYIWEG